MSAKRRVFGSLVIFFIFFCSLWFANDAFSELFGFVSNVVFSPTIFALLMVLVILLFQYIYWFLAMRHGEEKAIIKCKKNKQAIYCASRRFYRKCCHIFLCVYFDS
ncbi:hypothetical protein SD66_21885 [Enterobacter cloacae]|nr:hypothetical protein SD66_21885 [Enterobacter cloacae]